MPLTFSVTFVPGLFLSSEMGQSPPILAVHQCGRPTIFLLSHSCVTNDPAIAPNTAPRPPTTQRLIPFFCTAPVGFFFLALAFCFSSFFRFFSSISACETPHRSSHDRRGGTTKGWSAEACGACSGLSGAGSGDGSSPFGL
jgi:hypothetical protein